MAKPVEIKHSLASDFRAQADSDSIRERKATKHAANIRNRQNRQILGDWCREIARNGNKPTPFPQVQILPPYGRVA